MFKVLALIIVAMAIVVVYAEDATTGVTRHHRRDHTGRPEVGFTGNHKDHLKHPKDFHGTGKPHWHKGEQKGEPDKLSHEHGHRDHKVFHQHHDKKFSKPHHESTLVAAEATTAPVIVEAVAPMA